MSITLYDLASAEADRRFSPFCWRTHMALAHKVSRSRPYRGVSLKRTSCLSPIEAACR
jgi:hypothetical protein